MSIKISQITSKAENIYSFEQLKEGILYKINGLAPHDSERFDCFPEVYLRVGDSLIYFGNGRAGQDAGDSNDKFIKAPLGTTVTLTND